MKTYKKALIAIGAIIGDFLISYFSIRFFIYIGYAQAGFIYGSRVDFYSTMVGLMFMAPFALSTVALVIFTIVKLIHDIYIGSRYGIKVAYKDHENNRDNF